MLVDACLSSKRVGCVFDDLECGGSMWASVEDASKRCLVEDL